MRRGRAGLATWAAVLAAGLAAPAALAKPKQVPLATPGDPPILIGPGRAQVEYSGPDASLPGPFAESVESRIVDKVHQLVKKTEKLTDEK